MEESGCVAQCVARGLDKLTAVLLVESTDFINKKLKLNRTAA